MIAFLFSALLCLVFVSSVSATCQFPAPAASFSYSGYAGKWYEIGKIQTAGGAFFERNCVCTELNISIENEKTGDAKADNDCRDKTVTGKWTNVTGTLYDASNPPGRWLEKLNPFVPAVNYTVIALGEDYAVEYDCGTSFGITNYCIHVMSRTRTMDENKFKELMDMAEAMGLNPQNLPRTITKQEGC